MTVRGSCWTLMRGGDKTENAMRTKTRMEGPQECRDKHREGDSFLLNSLYFGHHAGRLTSRYWASALPLCFLPRPFKFSAQFFLNNGSLAASGSAGPSSQHLGGRGAGSGLHRSLAT